MEGREFLAENRTLTSCRASRQQRAPPQMPKPRFVKLLFELLPLVLLTLRSLVALAEPLLPGRAPTVVATPLARHQKKTLHALLGKWRIQERHNMQGMPLPRPRPPNP